MANDSPSRDQGSHFLTKVETLRGIAALMVALGHSLIVLSVNDIPNIWERSLLELTQTQAVITRTCLIFFNGSAAVTIFFVISGLVLGLSLDRRTAPLLPGLLSFYTKRLFRIFPVHLLAILLIGFYLYNCHLFNQYPNTSTWFNWWYRTPITLSSLLQNLTLISTDLNPITWTLQVELVASAFFPFFHLMNRRCSNILMNSSICFLLTLAAYLFPENLSLRYGFAFYLGLTIPQWGSKLWKARSQPTCLFSLLLALSFLLLARTVHEPHNLFLIALQESIGAVLLLSLIVYRDEMTIFSLLEDRFLRKLGKISYTFYVCHFFILYTISLFLLKYGQTELTGNQPLILNLGLGLFSVTATILLSLPVSHYFEMPLNKFGKRVAQQLFLRQ